MGTTGQPAMVYLPAGTYLMTGSIQLYVGTVIIGDALNPPILKASSNFQNDHIIYGKDPNQPGTVNFYMALKNVQIDSTSVPTSKTLALLDWTVSQGTQLTNVYFNMPTYSSHIGLTTQYDYNSNTILVRSTLCRFVSFNVNNRMNTRMTSLLPVVTSLCS
jgi:glucan 1,3-beta-glucosidase